MLGNTAKQVEMLQELIEKPRLDFFLPQKSNAESNELPYRLPSVSVVIPTLNEAKNLPHVLPCVPEWVHEVLIVDGLSTDNTIEVALSLRDDVKIVKQEGRGKGAALRSGFKAATGDIIVMLDADGSTDPAEIPVYVGALLAGADFAKGSRFLQGGGTTDMEFHRRMGNLFFTMAARSLFGGTFTDLCYGYNAFWKDAIDRLELDGDGFEIETMMNVRALYQGLKVAEVPSFESPRIFGTSNLHAWRDGLRVLRTLLKERVKAAYYQERQTDKYTARQSIARLINAALAGKLSPVRQAQVKVG